MALEQVFDHRTISCGLWSANLLDLTPYIFYLWVNLKDKFYRKNPHMEKLKETYEDIFSEFLSKKILSGEFKPI
jgi:hypothetical protein